MGIDKVFGICMVKNAEDIIGPVVQNMLWQADEVLVADNLSTDYTRNILEGLASEHTNLHIVEDNDPAYRQSEKMTALAHQAYAMGAEWIIPFDADEWWYSVSGNPIAEVLRENRYTINVAPLYDHVPTGKDDQNDPNPITRIGYRRNNPTPLVKVACQYSPTMVIAMGNHNVFYADRDPTYSENLIAIRHFPYRTPEQFVEKAITGNKALSLTDLPFEMGQHWRQYAAIAEQKGPEALQEVFLEWFYSDDPEEQNLIYDPAP